MGSPEGHKSYQEACPSMSSSLLRSAACSMGSKRSLRDPPAPVWVCSMGCRGISLQHLEQLLRAPLLLSLVSAGLCLSHILTHSCHNYIGAVTFFTYICYHKAVTVIPGCLSRAQCRVHPGAGWRWSCLTWGKLLAAFHRSHPCSHLATKTWAHTPHTLVKKVLCI